jgi:poly(3-hydroxybutyrate) depolymerase
MHRLLRGTALLVAAVAIAPVAATHTAPAPRAAQAQNPAGGADRIGRFLAVLEDLEVAPTHARIQSRSYDFKAAGVRMGYELYVPSSYDRAKPAPLIVALHCLYSDAAHMIRYEGLTDLAEARGYIVVAPMGYNSHGWYGNVPPGGRPSRPRDGEPADPPNLGELSEQDVMNVLELTRQEFNIDPSRIYLMGHSMGGGGTWYLAIKHPTLFAAIAPAAPAIYTSPDALAAITHIPVTVVQGEDDELVSVDTTRRWVATMKALGMRYTYIEVPGGDHMRVLAKNKANMTRVFDMFDGARKK